MPAISAKWRVRGRHRGSAIQARTRRRSYHQAEIFLQRIVSRCLRSGRERREDARNWRLRRHWWAADGPQETKPVLMDTRHEAGFVSHGRRPGFRVCKVNGVRQAVRDATLFSPLSRTARHVALQIGANAQSNSGAE